MRGGSEQLGLEQVILLRGAYLEPPSALWTFEARQIGENDVEIHFFQRSPNAREIPHLNMTRNQYENVFLPVVDSGVNNQPQQLRGINYRGFPGSWWNIATLEGRQGGYKHRSHKRSHKRSGKSSHKRSGKSSHKRSSHQGRKSHTKKSCRRRH